MRGPVRWQLRNCPPTLGFGPRELGCGLSYSCRTTQNESNCAKRHGKLSSGPIVGQIQLRGLLAGYSPAFNVFGRCALEGVPHGQTHLLGRYGRWPLLGQWGLVRLCEIPPVGAQIRGGWLCLSSVNGHEASSVRASRPARRLPGASTAVGRGSRTVQPAAARAHGPPSSGGPNAPPLDPDSRAWPGSRPRAESRRPRIPWASPRDHEPPTYAASS
jgi:hypothetical protein